MAVSFDSDVNDKVVSVLNQSLESLNSEVRNKILVDFDPFLQVNLFSTQLSTLKGALDNLEKLYDSLKTAIQANKNQWNSIDEQVGVKIGQISTGGNNSGGSNGTGSGNAGSNYLGSSNMSSISSGVSVNTSDVSNFITSLDADTTVALLKKLFKLKGENDLMTLLTEARASGVLLWMLKKILGDTTADLSSENTLESQAIQKALLAKINVNNYDLSTTEGKSNLEKVVLEKINDSSVDESKLNQAIYGDNTITVNMLDGTWVVAKTATGLQSYASYVASNGVRQNVDTSKYGDSCLAFSYAHAYDLYTGSKTTTVQAGNYAHGGNFVDFINDDKSTVLNKIYDEIMKGKPVVLQVNGNKQGTSRHFVTVVGFKSGITSADSLTEDDLLIMDSWDGKIERMDTSTSRFMTTGAACRKDYSGYRLRVLKDSVSA